MINFYKSKNKAKDRCGLAFLKPRIDVIDNLTNKKAKKIFENI